MRKSLFCATLALVLSAGGSAVAQRRAPSGGRHATAVHRGAVVHRGPRRTVTIHSRIAGPVFVARPRIYRPHVFGSYAYRPHFRSAFSFGLYFGSPYRYYYPYAYTYPAYAYPYYYPYTYPPVSVYPYPYSGSVSVAPVMPADTASTAPDESADERIVAPQSPEEGVRGFVAITDAPADATIYVDGNYAGRAADFTADQPLSEPAGVHQLEIRTPGQRTVIVHIDVQPGRVLQYSYPQ